MKERILLVGEDPALLATRAFLLAEWHTKISNTEAALPTMQAEPFDVVIIGQLVPVVETKRLIAEARKLNPAPSILLVRFIGDDIDFGVETHFANSEESPGWLQDCVARLLAERKGS
ncbi:MAG: hypothetical protein WA869_09785 [Alloacidobacterium sp.]|jgi:hypothetical protein